MKCQGACSSLGASLEVEVAGKPTGFHDALPITRKEDFEGLRIFIYELPTSFHAGLVANMQEKAQAAGSNCDFMLSPCTEKRHVGDWSTARQWGAEVVLLRKFLASPARVRDPSLADIFVVPYLIATACRLTGHYVRCPTPMEFSFLFQRLWHYNLATRHRHLFLGTMDAHSLPLTLQAQPLYASYGASARGHDGQLVVPPSVAEAEFQPGPFRSLPLEKRDILFWLAQTPNNVVRYMLQRQLITFDQLVSESERVRMFGHGARGRILVHVMGRNTGTIHPAPAPKDMLSEMRRSVFCPAPPAENTAAGTKRFFDVLLAGCLPVVIKFESIWGSGISWWRRDGAPIEWSMPFPWEIDWRRLAVEVPVAMLERDAGFVQAVLGVSLKEREAKLSYLLEVRERLLYNFAGGRRDAFSVFMDGLREALPKLDAVALMQGAGVFRGLPGLGRSPTSTICECSPRGLDFHRLPVDFGPGTGHEKGWTHSNSEISCRSAASWRPIRMDLKAHAFLSAPEYPVVAERFFTSWLHRSEFGMGTFLQALSSSELATGTENAVLATAPLSFCSQHLWPMACHDRMIENADGELVLTFCNHSSLLNLPPNTTCRMLPPVLPHLPAPGFLGTASAPVHWELVTWGCNLAPESDNIAAEFDGAVLKGFAEEWEVKWRERMPPNHILTVVIYEVCAPDAISKTTRGRMHASESTVLLEHLIAIAHAQLHGQPTADVVLLVPDLWVRPWVTPWEMRPAHFVMAISELLQASLPDMLEAASRSVFNTSVPANFSNSSGDPGRLGRWLILLDGPPGDADDKVVDKQQSEAAEGKSLGICEKYADLLSTNCPVPSKIVHAAPQALAFPSELLHNTSFISDWEVVATHRDGQTDGYHWRPIFNFIATLVIRQLNDNEVKITSFNFGA